MLNFAVRPMFLKKYISILFRYKIAILCGIVAATAFLGYHATRMRTDNSIEIWLSDDDKDLAYYQSFLDKFGDEEFLVVAFSAIDMFSQNCIREINAIAEKMKKLEGVKSVASLAGVFKDKVASPHFKEIVRRQNRPPLALFKRQITTDPAYQKTLISKDGKTTAIVAVVKCVGPESRKQLVAEVKKLLIDVVEKQRAAGSKVRTYHVAGPSVVNAELDRMSKQDMARFTPLMFGLSVAVLGCLFRRTSGVLIPVITVGVCFVWVTGCFVLFGQTMNMISNMLLPLTFIVSLATSIHLISHYYHELATDHGCDDTFDTQGIHEDACASTGIESRNRAAISHTLRHVGVPILMTTITTAIGFLSLATSNIPPVRVTGLFMGGCAVLTFMVSMAMIPILLSFVPLGDRIWMNIRKRFCLSRTPQMADGVLSSSKSKREGTVTVMEEEERGISALLDRLWYFITRHRNGILLSTLLVGAVFIFFTLRIQVESDIMASFPENSRIMRDNAFIEKHLMGLLPVEIVADTANGASILQPNALINLVYLQQYLHIMPEVTSACAITNYIQRANQFVNGDKPQYYTLPETEKEAADYLKLASIYGDKYVSTLYANNYTSARTSVRMKQVGSNRYGEIVDSIKEFIENKLDTKNLSWHITGIVPLMINVQDNILWSEIQSFSLAFLLTFISTAVALKSVKIGLISIIPNLLPITVTIGLMGMCGMKLDAATIMIASIALGISVDNTIHIFYRFKKELSIDGDHAKAMRATLQGVGKTALFTSLSAAFGFMVFSFSSFKPVQYFGFLTCVTLLNAIVSDLLISPSCLLFFKPRF